MRSGVLPSRRDAAGTSSPATILFAGLDGATQIAAGALFKADRRTMVGGQFRFEELQFAVVMEPPHGSHVGGYRVSRIEDDTADGYGDVLQFAWAAPSSV